VGLLLAVGALTACQGVPEPADSTPAFASDDEAFAAAEETYRAYVDALNEVDLSDPETFEPVFAWTTGELNAEDRETLTSMHADDLTVVGDSVVARVKGSRVEDSGKRVLMDVCLDVSGVDVRDPAGESVVQSGRSPVQALQITLIREGSDSPLVLSSIMSRESGLPCD
jgi:hypothetical protein